MIAFLMIAGLGVLALLSRLAALTRMTIPLLYTVSMLTVFHLSLIHIWTAWNSKRIILSWAVSMAGYCF